MDFLLCPVPAARRRHQWVGGGRGGAHAQKSEHLDAQAGHSCRQNPSSRVFLQAGPSLFYWAVLVPHEPPHLGAWIRYLTVGRLKTPPPPPPPLSAPLVEPGTGPGGQRFLVQEHLLATRTGLLGEITKSGDDVTLGDTLPPFSLLKSREKRFRYLVPSLKM